MTPHRGNTILFRSSQQVWCAALGVEVPGHRQEQLTQTLIVRLLKTHFFTHRSLIVKSQQNRIGLVAKPVTPLLQPGYESCGSGVPERPFAEGRDPGLAFRQHVRLQAVQDLLHHQTQSSYPAKLSQEPHFTPSFLQEPQEKVSHKRVLPMTPWF